MSFTVSNSPRSRTILLNDYLKSNDQNLINRLELLTRLAETINHLHTRYIIHNDIHPGNIRIDVKTLSVLLTPSDLSFSFSIKKPEITNKDHVRGQIAYLSPERTGHTADHVDFRSDLYCYGVIMYEALTGVLPFDFDDPAQILHGHVAIPPKPIHEVNSEVPLILSDITLKLLAKNPADRYQSIGGLIADLSHCMAQLEESGRVLPFPIAREDVSSLFEIPNKLYGRFSEIKRIVDEYQRALNGGVGILFINGPPGIGKSYLVNETQANLLSDHGAFANGKFDQYERTIPFSAVYQAFTCLAKQILTMDDEAFGRIRKDIAAAAGDSGTVIIDAIPELALIMGTQPAVEMTQPTDNENRFNSAFITFIRAVARSAGPLILFLDDLHWADTDSLNLIHALLSDTKLSHLLFIGCYRDIEAGENPAFGRLLNTLKAGNPSNFIALDSVDNDYVAMLLEDTLSIDAELNRDFVQFIVQRTSGNPLFIKEFLLKLYRKGWIRFVRGEKNPQKNYWHIDMEEMLEAPIPASVVDLLTERLLKQPAGIQQMLKTAACVGTEFNAQLLAHVTETKVKSIRLLLSRAVEQGMINETGKGYKFIHDRVQEVAYHLNSQNERAATHHTIGRIIKEGIALSNPGEDLFSAVSQLNHCRQLLGLKERRELTELNLKAGQKAKRLNAYTNALAYINVSLELLTDNCWKDQYDLTLSIHTEAAKIASILGDIGYVKEIVHRVSEKADSLIDGVKVHESLIWGLTSKNMHTEAVRESLIVLKKLGFDFPENPSNFRMLREFVSTYFALVFRSNRSLHQLRETQDAYFLAASRIMQIIYRSVQASNMQLYILMVFRGIKLSLKHGNTPDTPIRIAIFGGLLCCNTKAINAGYRLGQLASMLASMPHTERNKAETLAFVNGSIRPWKHHLRESLAPMLDVFNLGMDTGSAVRIGAINWYCAILFFTGEPLKNMVRKLNDYNEILRRYKLGTYLIHNEILLQAVLNLSGLSAAPTRLTGDAYNEEIMVPVHESGNDQTSLSKYHFCKMYLNYHFDDYDSAEKSANKLVNHLQVTMGTFYTAMDFFYDSLTRLAWLEANRLGNGRHEINPKFIIRHKRNLEKRWQLKIVAANQKKMKRWAVHAPMNFLNKWSLVEAELSRVVAKKERAVHYYKQAIALSRAHMYLQEEALSNELLAKFYLSENDDASAKSYMIAAHNLYGKWGAMAKCRQMEKVYGRFFSPAPKAKTDTFGFENKLPPHAPVLNLSALAVQMLVDATRIISNQNDIENYFTRLSNTIMKFSGAQRVLLLVCRDNRLSIGIDHRTGAQEATILKQVPKKKSIFAESIVKYVMRTNQVVLLDNAHGTQPYAIDPYIKNNQAKSVICLPVNHEDRLLAILYIENNLNYGVFGSQNNNVLRSICNHIALSFENRFLKEAVARLSEKDRQPSPKELMESLQSNYGLTPQEAKVASLLKEGYTRTQVCEELAISLKTLRRHLQSLYNKTINIEDDFNSDGRVDKLSRLILFLFKHCET